MNNPVISFLIQPLSSLDKAIAFCIGYGILFFAYNDCVNRQWDFPVYYLAAHSIADHQNPYDPAILKSISDSREEVGYGGGLPYLYPPHIARLLFPLKTMNFFTASFIWMAAKCAALEAILFLSLVLMKIPIHPVSLIATHIIAVFYRPAAIDFNAGNIATFEAALIVAGLTAWSLKRYAYAGFFTALGCSFKGTPFLITLYPLHLRDIRYIIALIISGVLLGFVILYDWQALIQCLTFYRSPEWEQIWDEQVQSFYNCSSTTVILRTFSQTYFADPLWEAPVLANILIPLFPITIFGIIAYTIQRKNNDPSLDKTDGALLSMILCGVLLLPPRLAGYTLVWTLFPFLQIITHSIQRKSYIALFAVIIGFVLIQLNLPPNHIPSGILQLFIDKDFFGLLLFFLSAVWLCNLRPKSI